jgi:integrase/recombinase XerC
MLTKQAKVLSARELQRLLDDVTHSRHPERNRVMVLLSFKAGLRAIEIAGLRWGMLTDASGELTDHIALQNKAAKGKSGGRAIPMHPELRLALEALREAKPDKVRADWPVIYSERGAYSANSIAVWFYERFSALGLKGASSHSGRRTFITTAARKIVEAGGSLRDVQDLAGHASLGTTQRYIDSSAEAKRKVIGLL